MYQGLLVLNIALRHKLVTAMACLGIVIFGAIAPCAAQPANTVPRYTHVDSFPVFNTFSPDRWGIVGVTVTNPTEKPLDLLASHYFNDRPDLQFARRAVDSSPGKTDLLVPHSAPAGSAPNVHANQGALNRQVNEERGYSQGPAGSDGLQRPAAIVER